MILATLVAAALPLLFLALVRWLDLYATGSFKGVLVCLGWGFAAFWLALQANTLPAGLVGFTLLVTLVAPILEEICSILPPETEPLWARLGAGVRNTRGVITDESVEHAR